MTRRCYLGVFVSRFCHIYLEDSLCWGSVYLGLLTGHYFGGFVIVLSSGVRVYSICGIGILVAFCKLGNSGSIH